MISKGIFRSGSVRYVRLGDLDITTDSDGALPQEFQIEYRDLIKHPYYDAAYNQNDIGLIRLSTPAILNSHVVPACLNTNDVNYNNEAYATGWFGMDETTCVNQLKKVRMLEGKHEECLNRRYGERINEDTICTRAFGNNFAHKCSVSFI